ncbi:DNA cytosine methyltransferase [Brevibacillus humidisoli]|uniref:DNA cytosine methyltransferase n=1 Tax=Brevibacillus humidisoli TaxID=2895522 RepID=UPI001E2F7FF5|nr:DNA cytosine methyltransferase [Brevibacillus humidisoli]UFJ40406.1 DNA cytosine methyltransferase [Brevibacillus humidisoli]
MKLQELLESVTTNAIGINDYREYKSALFTASENALLSFEPLNIGETAGNPIQVLDFFSGAGGTSLGFAAINRIFPVFRFLGGCDINSISAATYSKNFGTPLLNNDILKISQDRESIKSFLESINFDSKLPTVLIGCAPCQGFSSHRKKRWDEEDDERNNLVIAFSRIVSEVNPTVFIMENVPEFLSNKYWKYFSKARTAFFNAGYIVKQHIYNAAEFGVPQERFRSVIIGMKKEFLLPEGVYTPDKYRTVRDAIGSLSPLAAGEASTEDWMHKAVAHKPSTLEVIRQVPHDGGKLPEGVGPECLTRVNGFSDVYGRLSWDKPSITITHYARNPASGRFTHPVQDRGLTAREAARLQSFPDGFAFEGKFDDIYRQIGEAVPPLLSCGIASSVLIELLSCEPSEAQLSAGIQAVDLPVSNSYSSVIAGIKSTRRFKNAVNLC